MVFNLNKLEGKMNLVVNIFLHEKDDLSLAQCYANKQILKLNNSTNLNTKTN